MKQTESVSETLADLNLTRLSAREDLIAKFYTVSLSMILPDSQR
jgi:hypothetical protein